MTDDELKFIYTNAPVGKATFEVISIYASWFSRKYYLQNAFTYDVEVLLEDDVTEVIAEYVPMNITQSGSDSDMSNERTFNIQAVNDQIAEEMDNRDYESDEGIQIESRKYVLYRDGSISTMKDTVVKTVISNVTRNIQGVNVSSSSKPVTSQRTGEIATINRVPMIEGFV